MTLPSVQVLFLQFMSCHLAPTQECTVKISPLSSIPFVVVSLNSQNIRE